MSKKLSIHIDTLNTKTSSSSRNEIPGFLHSSTRKRNSVHYHRNLRRYDYYYPQNPDFHLEEHFRISPPILPLSSLHCPTPKVEAIVPKNFFLWSNPLRPQKGTLEVSYTSRCSSALPPSPSQSFTSPYRKQHKDVSWQDPEEHTQLGWTELPSRNFQINFVTFMYS